MRSVRRDLAAANDRCMLQQRELDRLRSLLSESRSEHLSQIEALSKQQAESELRASKAEAMVTTVRAKLDKAELDLKEAVESQAKQARVVREVRAEMSERMTSLIATVHQREEEIHKLQFQLRESHRFKDQAAMLEKVLASREEAISDLTIRYGELRSEYDLMAIETAGLKSTLNARAASEARSASMIVPSHVSSMPPPPAAPATDPHVKETASAVVLAKEWALETDRSIMSLEELLEAQFDCLQDLRLVLEKGSVNVGQDALGSAAAHVDRQRLSHLRRTEQRRLEQQMAAVSDHASTAALMKAIMSNAKFNLGKLKHSAEQLTDYISSLKQLAERHCVQAGLPALQNRWDAMSRARPEPLPMPTSGGVAAAAEKSSPPPPSSPAAPSPSVASAALVAENEMLEKKLRAAEASLDELNTKLSAARREQEGIITSYESKLREASQRHYEERSAAAREIDELRALQTRSQREFEGQLAAITSQHVAQLQDKDRERGAIVGDLQGRIASLERELEESLASKLRDAAAVEDAKLKRKALKSDLLAARQEADELAKVVQELNADVESAHQHIDRLEAEAESLRSVLDFEINQREAEKLEAASFANWRSGVGRVAQAAEQARLQKFETAAGREADGVGNAAGRPAAAGHPNVAFVRPSPGVGASGSKGRLRGASAMRAH